MTVAVHLTLVPILFVGDHVGLVLELKLAQFLVLVIAVITTVHVTELITFNLFLLVLL